MQSFHRPCSRIASRKVPLQFTPRLIRRPALSITTNAAPISSTDHGGGKRRVTAGVAANKPAVHKAPMAAVAVYIPGHIAVPPTS